MIKTPAHLVPLLGEELNLEHIDLKTFVNLNLICETPGCEGLMEQDSINPFGEYIAPW